MWLKRWSSEKCIAKVPTTPECDTKGRRIFAGNLTVRPSKLRALTDLATPSYSSLNSSGGILSWTYIERKLSHPIKF